MDCILHIGIGKAGSSSLQAYLQAERTRLADVGVLYPNDPLPSGQVGGDNHKCLAVSAMRASRGNFVLNQHRVKTPQDRARFDTRIEEVYAKQVQDHPGHTCVLSAEHFWSCLVFDDEIAALRARLDRIGLSVTQLVIYLRRQSDWFESYLHQRVREGRGALERTAEAIVPSPGARQLDYPAIISKWQAQFPEAALKPRLFDKNAMIGSEIVSDFFATAELPNPSYAPIATDDVARVSNAGTNALLHLRQRLEAMSDGQVDGTVWRRVVALIEAHMPGSCALLPDYEMHAIDAAFAESNEEVRRTYFPERDTLFSNVYIGRTQETFYDLKGPEIEDLFNLIFALWQKGEAA